MITKCDVIAVAQYLQMEPSEDVIQDILNNYSEGDYPTENFTEIIEIMLYERMGH